MPQYTCIDSRVEVNGQTVLSIVSGMGASKDRGLEILRDCDIIDPTPDNW